MTKSLLQNNQHTQQLTANEMFAVLKANGFTLNDERDAQVLEFLNEAAPERERKEQEDASKRVLESLNTHKLLAHRASLFTCIQSQITFGDTENYVAATAAHIMKSLLSLEVVADYFIEEKNYKDVILLGQLLEANIIPLIQQCFVSMNDQLENPEKHGLSEEHIEEEAEYRDNHLARLFYINVPVEHLTRLNAQKSGEVVTGCHDYVVQLQRVLESF